MGVPEKTFQSTRPVRGATVGRGAGHDGPVVSIHAPRAGRDGAARVGQGPDKVSIHAPRAGRDDMSVCAPARSFVVSIHAPRAGRDCDAVAHVAADLVSIHAPRAGRDGQLEIVLVDAPCVSIHAPRAGRDSRALRAPPPSGRFNPRAPCGARLISQFFEGVGVMFQSTRPVRGATLLVQALHDLKLVSIHAPRAGRDGGR